MAKALTVSVRIDGVRETLAAFGRMDKAANDALREAAGKLAEDLAGKIRAAAQSDPSPQASLMAATVRPRRDRVPVVVAGGATAVGRRRVPAWTLLFGAEFGANQYDQFHKPHTGKAGSWMFGVAEREAATIDREWNAAADQIVREFGARP